MDLLALADFVLVARHGGFGAAARASLRPKATLSRRVAELEATVDARLFERGRRDLKLTEEGRALFERAGASLLELEEAAAAIGAGNRHVRGRLRISVPLLFGQTAMGRLAAGFVRRHPEARLEVTTDDRMVDMIEEGYDLAIRVNPAPDETLVGRAFLRDRLVVVAAPELDWDPDSPAPAVVRTGDTGAHWTLEAPNGVHTVPVQPVMRLSSVMMIREAVCAGAGMARLPLSLVSRDMAAKRLSHRGDVAGPPIALWALYPSRRLLNARVSAFLDHLHDAFPCGTPEELAAFVV